MANNEYGPSIVLFQNRDRETGERITDPTKPSMTGKLSGLNTPEILAAIQAGEDLRVAVWTKTPKKQGGDRLLSGVVEVFKKIVAGITGNNAPAQPPASNEELPF